MLRLLPPEGVKSSALLLPELSPLPDACSIPARWCLGAGLHREDRLLASSSVSCGLAGNAVPAGQGAGRLVSAMLSRATDRVALLPGSLEMPCLLMLCVVQAQVLCGQGTCREHESM